VLLATLLFLVGAGLAGGGVFAKLSSGGFEDPAAESTVARAALETQFQSGEPTW
jgi:RND superfamily putative drug exporter